MLGAKLGLVDSYILLHTPCSSVESLVGKISHKIRWNRYLKAQPMAACRVGCYYSESGKISTERWRVYWRDNVAPMTASCACGEKLSLERRCETMGFSCCGGSPIDSSPLCRNLPRLGACPVDIHRSRMWSNRISCRDSRKSLEVGIGSTSTSTSIIIDLANRKTTKETNESKSSTTTTAIVFDR